MRWILATLCFAGTNCFAQTIENFSLVNVRDEKVISLDDFKEQAGVVIIFTSTKCPYDGYYVSRIKELAETNSKTPVLLVNSNIEESVDEMKSYINKNGLTIPYLMDKVHNVFTALRPTKSPECFLLQRKGGKFVVAYRGAIDDNPQTAGGVNHSYLKDAIKKLKANQKVEPADVRPVGCSIKVN
jgi:peroxiredoxin